MTDMTWQDVLHHLNSLFRGKEAQERVLAWKPTEADAEGVFHLWCAAAVKSDMGALLGNWHKQGYTPDWEEWLLSCSYDMNTNFRLYASILSACYYAPDDALLAAMEKASERGGVLFAKETLERLLRMRLLGKQSGPDFWMQIIDTQDGDLLKFVGTIRWQLPGEVHKKYLAVLDSRTHLATTRSVAEVMQGLLDENALNRVAAASNSTAGEMLETLVADPSPFVRSAARDTAKRLGMRELSDKLGISLMRIKG